ncbi:hypothetical protein A4G99_12235 [Haladaptatus sp. R4]|uniref:hypothetical protein n=1 Tax=Haladaptatus sp. R4 TaxID=1679489 RepID=UPI0007B48A53|nr:hypothetical protein [Haladaptatus sp. R4]KZN23650.1 hypothetical protein A4G99_12235 [Haladaptatus sp. R4]
MNRPLLYHAATGLLGLSFAVRSVPDILSGESSIVLWMAAIAGVGLVLGSIYEILTGGREDFEPSRRITLIVVAGAVISALGVVVSSLG